MGKLSTCMNEAENLGLGVRVTSKRVTKDVPQRIPIVKMDAETKRANKAGIQKKVSQETREEKSSVSGKGFLVSNPVGCLGRIHRSHWMLPLREHGFGGTEGQEWCHM